MTLAPVHISDINLIPQDKDNACWWASTLMMYDWCTRRGGKAPDPRSNPHIVDAYKKNNGLAWAVMVKYAQMVGMKRKPLMSPTIETLRSWLSVGPLWTDGIAVDWQGNVAGNGHVVVLAGVREPLMCTTHGERYEVYVLDPWPVKKGHQGWRPISHLVEIMQAGANPARNVTFLHY